MYCPNCGKEIPDGSKFCQFCGEKLQSVVPEKKIIIKHKKEKKPLTKEKKRKIITIGAVSAVLAVVILYFGLYIAAGKLVDKREFTKANKCLPAYKLTALHDPNLVKYVHAGLVYDAKDYETAQNEFLQLGSYKESIYMANKSLYELGIEEINNKEYYLARTRFEQLVEVNYEDADKMIDEVQYQMALDYLEKDNINQNLIGLSKLKTLSGFNYSDSKQKYEVEKERLYELGVSNYRKNEFADLPTLFQGLNGYKDSNKYLNLISAKSSTNYFFLTMFDKDLIDNLKNQISFEDTKEVLVLNHAIARAFLTGTWKTSNGSNYFKIDENSGQSSYNLPWLELSNSYYEIEDGIYKIHNDTTSKNMYKFTVVSADQITVYCYKNGSTYTLYRQ